MNDAIRAETLIADIGRLSGARCPCSATLCGHALLFSFLLGFKSQPRCAPCLANAMGRPAPDFASHLIDTIRHRACYNAAWLWASARERACLVASVQPVSAPDQTASGPVDVDAGFDAGDMGCGDLALELRIKLQSMARGAVVQVIARDPGAPADIPAWCRLTGNPLVFQNHPIYLIQKET